MVADQIAEYRVDTAAVQETKWTGEGNAVWSKYTLHYSGHRTSEKESFYAQLEVTLDRIPRDDVKVVLWYSIAIAGNGTAFFPTIRRKGLDHEASNDGTERV